MLPFHKLFGAVEGNGVSPFARNFETPNDLITTINAFFKPPATNPRNGTNNDNKKETQESDEDSDEDSEGASLPRSTSKISTAFLEERLAEIIDLGDVEEEETKSDENESSQYDLVQSPERVDSSESFFDDGDGSAALTMLRHMLSQTSITDVSMYAYKLTQVCVCVCLSNIQTTMKVCANR